MKANGFDRKRDAGCLFAGVRGIGIAGCLCLLPVSSVFAQSIYQTEAGEMLLFESAGASRVVEEVRAGAPGVMVEIFVKPGDPVRKGQVLGHTELDATKLQLDLARLALESKAKIEAARNQAEAWTVTREETEESVRKRKQEKSRLDWAIAMEQMYQANYESQLDAERVQQVQFAYWKDQYEKRFFRAPVDGVVSEVKVELGKNVNFATHVFTVTNDTTFTVPVKVPAPVAVAAVPQGTLPVRASDGKKSVSRARVDSVKDDPRLSGGKIIKLHVKATDFPATTRANLIGMKFDVLLPRVTQ